MSHLRKRIRDIGPYMINEKQLGEYNDQVTAIVVDNLISRDNRKLIVKPIRSANPEIWIGMHTVAVFRVKRPVTNPVDVICIDSVDSGMSGISVMMASSDTAQAKVIELPASKLQDTQVNVTSLLVNHLNQLKMKRKNFIFRDPGVPGADAEQPEATIEQADDTGGDSADNAGTSAE